MPSNWMMKIELRGSSFENLKHLLSQAHAHVRDAQNYRAAGDSWSVKGDGCGGEAEFWSVIIESPIEERIKALREEADALEAQAGLSTQKSADPGD